MVTLNLGNFNSKETLSTNISEKKPNRVPNVDPSNVKNLTFSFLVSKSDVPPINAPQCKDVASKG